MLIEQKSRCICGHPKLLQYRGKTGRATGWTVSASYESARDTPFSSYIALRPDQTSQSGMEDMMSRAPRSASLDTDAPYLDFETHPDRYQHWQLHLDGRIAMLAMAVREEAAQRPGYALKLNSYDLGVDIELYDAVQRLRFEHPEVAVVVITSAHPRVFCAGANIHMLALSSHTHKVNFCKFTNETRNSIEDASAHSGQRYVCAINGPASGGGYELALACEHIILIDDGASAVSLPEVPLLAVLPGTGGLTRLVDKRHVRRDHADVFCTTPEGIRGHRALAWQLVDELAPRSRFDAVVQERAQALATSSDRPTHVRGISLMPLSRTIGPDHLTYDYLSVDLDRTAHTATFTVFGPSNPPPQNLDAIHATGAMFWPLAFARALDDAILHLRFHASEIGVWVFRSKGDHRLVAAVDTVLCEHAENWLVREITLYLKRVFQRLDVSSRSIFTLIEPGSCYSGALLELVLAADRSYMLEGTFDDTQPVTPATLRLTPLNFGPLPMINAQTRLQSRFPGSAAHLDHLSTYVGQDLDAAAAERLGLVTYIPDDIDWADEVRLAIEERASFSPDALTGMEANLRFAGRETIQSKIFGRLSTWQNWIFQRPNAVGDDGALSRYGTGQKSHFDRRRV